jgi:hypothetical protein
MYFPLTNERVPVSSQRETICFRLVNFFPKGNDLFPFGQFLPKGKRSVSVWSISSVNESVAPLVAPSVSPSSPPLPPLIYRVLLSFLLSFQSRTPI